MIENKSMKLRFYPPIKVHCWGGFGSQLNALALAHRLRELFGTRDIVLVIHEGGTHNAIFELEEIDLSDFNIELKVDPKPNKYRMENSSKAKVTKKKFKVSLTKVGKSFLKKMGFYNSCDSLKDIQKLKPWVLMIRGSYNLFPTEAFLNFLNLQLRDISIAENFDLVIHYRLGDLLTLQEKDPVEVSVLIDLVDTIEIKHEVKSIILLTSNPDIASRLFEKNNAQLAGKMLFYFARPIEVLSYGVAGQIFIGTNSKMSLWPIWLRSVRNCVDNYLPYMFQDELNSLNAINSKKLRVLFY
jgi:hypothetical protein